VPGRHVARENPPPWHLIVLLKLCGPGDVAREGIPFEVFRLMYLGRHVARETYPWRQVARDSPELSLGKMMKTSATGEYPSLINTFFLTHTVGGLFLNPEDKAFYDEMVRLQGLGSNTSTGVPYIEDEMMAIVRGGKHLSTVVAAGSGGCEDDEPRDDEDAGEDEEDEDDS
nr:hypothetical protein [Tanacetum cinerariifolium]